MTLSDDATPDHLVLDHPYFEDRPGSRFENETSYAGTGTVASPATYE